MFRVSLMNTPAVCSYVTGQSETTATKGDTIYLTTKVESSGNGGSGSNGSGTGTTDGSNGGTGGSTQQ